MRKFVLMLAMAMLLGRGAAAAVTFVSPLNGSQPFGLGLVEVTTDVAGVDRVDFLVDGVLAGVARVPPYRIAFDFGTSLRQRTITATVWSQGYTRSESATVRTAALTANETINVDLVEVPLRVRSTRKLTAADFRVRENGVEQRIRDVVAERPPAHFAFVVDRSLSMGDGKLSAALSAVESALDQLRPGDRASLVLFNHHVATAQAIDRRSDLALLFGDIAPSGGTSLRDALASIASDERTYAIVITDGGDRNSELSEEAALQKISGTKTIVSTVVLGTSHARFLDRATQNTGGTLVRASTSTMRETVSRVLTDINSRYLLVYQSNAQTGGWRNVQIRPRRGGIEVLSARKGYFAER